MQRKVAERRRWVSISAAIRNGRAKYPINMRLMSCVVAGGGPYSETGIDVRVCWESMILSGIGAQKVPSYLS